MATNQKQDTRQKPRTSWITAGEGVGWLVVIVGILGLILALATRQGLDLDLGLLSLVVTALGVVLATKIFAQQKRDSKQDQKDRDRILRKIESTTLHTNTVSENTETKVDRIVDDLNRALLKRTWHRLEPADEAAVVRAVEYRPMVGTPRILWADDNPGSIEFERHAFHHAGIVTIWTGSTSGALALLENNQFDLVITDMERNGNPQAGYELLQEIKRRQDDLPVIEYSSSDKHEHVQKFKEAGGRDATNKPDVLFTMVMAAMNLVSEPDGSKS